MSRGGRGGFPGGRGGFSGGGRDIPFEIDPNLKPDFAPSELFPPNPPPIQNALSREERNCITRFREFRDKVRNGPFYTVMARKRGLENPFEETEKYSRRYEKKRRMVPKLDARPYVFAFFPSELHTTLDPNHTVTPSDDRLKRNTKRLHFSSLETYTDDPITDPFLNDDDDDENKPKVDVERDEDVSVKDADEEDEEQEEDEDEDQFQDDAEGDYNAEQYFDSGEGEGWGDDGGGDDDGWF